MLMCAYAERWAEAPRCPLNCQLSTKEDTTLLSFFLNFFVGPRSILWVHWLPLIFWTSCGPPHVGFLLVSLRGNQWRMQDFPWWGHNRVGGANSNSNCAPWSRQRSLAILHKRFPAIKNKDHSPSCSNSSLNSHGKTTIGTTIRTTMGTTIERTIDTIKENNSIVLSTNWYEFCLLTF